MTEDPHVADDNAGDWRRAAECDEEDGVGVVGGPVEHTRHYLLVERVTAPVEVVRQHEGRGDRPYGAHHQQRPTPRVDHVIVAVLAQTYVAAKINAHINVHLCDLGDNFTSVVKNSQTIFFTLQSMLLLKGISFSSQ